MIGTTINEFAGFRDAPDISTWEEARKLLAETYGKHTDSVISEFRKAYPEAEPEDFSYLILFFVPEQ